MTALLERIVALIAPHTCLRCGIEDNIVCAECSASVFIAPNSACVLCGVPTKNWRICAGCGVVANLESVYPTTEYSGLAADVLKIFKFERAQAAAKPLAAAIAAAIPCLDPNTLIVPLPTAARRVRMRGYDQTLLIARELGKLSQLKVVNVLRRAHSARQVGADRKERHRQAKDAYVLTKAQLVYGRPVLLVDDICTTGASLLATSRLMRTAGASQINAAVVAWQRLDKKNN